jgi:hypothetical protein
MGVPITLRPHVEPTRIVYVIDARFLIRHAQPSFAKQPEKKSQESPRTSPLKEGLKDLHMPRPLKLW